MCIHFTYKKKNSFMSTLYVAKELTVHIKQKNKETRYALILSFIKQRKKYSVTIRFRI